PLARISLWVSAATEKGTSWREVSRFCAVTTPSWLAPSSTCCAMATRGSPATPATAVDMVRLLRKLARVRAMWVSPRVCEQPALSAGVSRLLFGSAGPSADLRKCAHDTHLRVFAATG